MKVNINERPFSHQHHVRELLNWLLSEVGSAGGDGDAVWVVKNLDIHHLRDFVLDNFLTEADKRYWTVSMVRDDKNFIISHHQECLLITTDQKDVPHWSQCTVIL